MCTLTYYENIFHKINMACKPMQFGHMDQNVFLNSIEQHG